MTIKPISTHCRNCGQESHYRGIYCWWGVRMKRRDDAFAVVCVACFIVYVLWALWPS